ncbi:MAG: TRAP transporter small permease subunit [Deltaproteobacteria bacterium]|nr:TRAP transporter small permease subunit [Deltaproteobacteria bacterium]
MGMGILSRVSRVWQRTEVTLAIGIALLEISILVGWVFLRGLSSHYTGEGDSAGLVVRAVAGIVLLGGVTHWALARTKIPVNARRLGVVVACAAGVIAARLGVDVGSDGASNLVAWLQSASVLALMGGPRGIVTRLTLWLALIGASLAAGRGKHINIDVATRMLPRRAVVPVTLFGWGVAAAVSFAATVGFLDSIAVTKFRADAFTSCKSEAGKICDTPVGERFDVVRQGLGVDALLFKTQLALDIRTLPRVLSGEPFDGWMTGDVWNDFLKDSDFGLYFSPEAVDGLRAQTADEMRTPAVVDPTTGEGRNRLIRVLDLILPFGLLVLGLKFVLRVLLGLTGEIQIEGEGTHEMAVELGEAP